MMRHTFILAHAQARQRAIEAVRAAPDGFAVTVGENTRTLDQNAAQWPILEAFAQQLQWPVNGALTWMSAEEWKDVLTAAFFQESARLATGLNGGVVMLGRRTSQFGRQEFGAWLEFLHAVAVERGVALPDPRTLP